MNSPSDRGQGERLLQIQHQGRGQLRHLAEAAFRQAPLEVLQQLQDAHLPIRAMLTLHYLHGLMSQSVPISHQCCQWSMEKMEVWGWLV